MSTDLAKTEDARERHKEKLYQVAYHRDRKRRYDALNDFMQTQVRPLELQAQAMAGWRLRGQQKAAALQSRRRPKEPIIEGPEMFGLFYSGPARRRLRKPGYEIYEWQLDSMTDLAEIDECLIPVRIEIDIDGHKVRDTFTWNVHEKYLTPELFSALLCDDLRIAQSFAAQVAAQIREQIDDFKQLAPYIMPRLDLFNIVSKLSDDQIKQYFNLVQEARDQLPPTIKAIEQHADKEAMAVVSSLNLPSDASKIPFELPGELRCPIKLNVTVGSCQVMDYFELDLYSVMSTRHTPEAIAETICRELGIGGEFLTAISHSIREQVWLHLKCLYCIGHTLDGAPILDEEVADWYLPVIEGRPLHADPDEWTPTLGMLTEYEMERLTRDRDRDSRRKRRATRGRRGVPAANTDQFGFGIQLAKSTPQVSADKNALAEFTDTVMEVQAPVVQAFTLPDMKEPQKTIRTLTKFPDLPVLGNPSESYEWLKKFVGVPEGAADATAPQSAPTTGRRKGGRAAAQQAANQIHAMSVALEQQDEMFAPTNQPPIGTGQRSPVQAPISRVQQLAKANSGWRCLSCGCNESQTPLRRRGPDNKTSLCNKCGLYYQKNGKLKYRNQTTPISNAPVISPVTTTLVAPVASAPSPVDQPNSMCVSKAFTVPNVMYPQWLSAQVMAFQARFPTSPLEILLIPPTPDFDQRILVDELNKHLSPLANGEWTHSHAWVRIYPNGGRPQFVRLGPGASLTNVERLLNRKS